MLKKFRLMVVFVLVMIAAACGGEDENDKPKISRINAQGDCSNYTLEVDWEGIPGEEHTLRQRIKNSDTVLGTATLSGDKGTFMWSGFYCADGLPVWDASKQACAFDLEIATAAQTSDLKGFEISCTP